MSMKINNERLEIRLNSGLKEDFIKLCDDNELKPSEVLRTLISDFVYQKEKPWFMR